MPKITPHPKLVSLGQKPPNDAIPFSGFVAPSRDGVVRLCEDLTGSRYIDFREKDVIDSAQDEGTGQTELLINPFSIVTVVSAVKAPLLSTLARSRPDGESPDGGTGKTCVEKRIEKCKNDPERNPTFCDSEEARNLFNLLCSVFGAPTDIGVIIA